MRYHTGCLVSPLWVLALVACALHDSLLDLDAV